MWMKKSMQRTSHRPFNKNVSVSPVRASSVQNCEAGLLIILGLLVALATLYWRSPNGRNAYIFIKGHVRS